jgi:hypothetical protein
MGYVPPRCHNKSAEIRMNLYAWQYVLLHILQLSDQLQREDVDHVVHMIKFGRSYSTTDFNSSYHLVTLVELMFIILVK